MSLRHRLRIFSFRYRKVGDVIFRERECSYDRQPDGIHNIGDIWREQRGNDLWVNLAVDYFDPPLSPYALERIETAFCQCELAAEQWIQAQYPGTTLE